MCHAFRILVSGLAVGYLAGCQIGPTAMQVGHPLYSQALTELRDEQLLLNLVRIRYSEMPVFLNVASISTQYEFNTSGGVDGTINEGPTAISPDVLGLSGDVGYSERPTITFSLPDSPEFFDRLLAPIGANRLAVLTHGGWGGSLVARFGIKKINRLENVGGRPMQSIAVPRSFEEFDEAVDLLEKLIREGLVDFGYGRKTIMNSSPISDVDGRGLAYALPEGGEFWGDKENGYALQTTKQLLHLRFSRAADDSPDATRLRELLDLQPGRYVFAMLDADDSIIERARVKAGQVPGALDPDVVWTEVATQTRSIMEIFHYASHHIRVPAEHLEDGIIRPLPTGSEGTLTDLFVIHSCKRKPRNAEVAVEYRNRWFYVAEDDVPSKGTFALLNALYSMTSITVGSSAPVLTLPIGGG